MLVSLSVETYIVVKLVRNYFEHSEVVSGPDHLCFVVGICTMPAKFVKPEKSWSVIV